MLYESIAKEHGISNSEAKVYKSMTKLDNKCVRVRACAASI